MTQRQASITYSYRDTEGQVGIQEWLLSHSKGYTTEVVPVTPTSESRITFVYTPADEVDVTELPPPNYMRWTEETRYHGKQ